MSEIARQDQDSAKGREAAFRPRVGDWDARKLIRGIQRGDLALTEAELDGLRDYFWFDLCAEYDSTHLHRHVHARGDALSPEFVAMEDAWYRDELNHTRGFLALYSILYDESEEEVESRLAERVPDFGPLSSFFGDEFRLCLLFAYDELATTRAYHLDIELYGRFGHPALLTWIKRLIRDEGYHHHNAIEVLRRVHGRRFAEAPRHIEDFVRWDLGDHRYRATFLFDHEWEHVDDAFYRDTGEILRKRMVALAETGGA